MAYELIANYSTGDSYGSYDGVSLIHRFNSKEVAIKAMERLIIHYKWYEWIEKSEYDKKRLIEIYKENPVEEPEWHKELEYSFQASYYLDDGTLFQDSMVYCGYFETLYTLEVVDSTEVKF